jgi:homospermidine synthase
MLEAGAEYVRKRITPDNMSEVLGEYLGAGDLLIDLAWNIAATDIIQWCHDNTVLYLNTSVEEWDPYQDAANQDPIERTLYVRHMKLRKMASQWTTPGATAVVEHGANPGLVSHWVKQGLEDMSNVLLGNIKRKDVKLPRRALSNSAKEDLSRYLADGDFSRMAMTLGVTTIHISERDTQISNRPKQVGEFVNTWSVEGFREEGIAPAEMGWGTHERRMPLHAHHHKFGPGNQICLAQKGINTFVRSWVPSGPTIGMVVRHGEAFTISDYLTVWHEDEYGRRPLYRPTVHYAYQPSDAALASLHELRANGYVLQEQQRIMNSDIISGKDEMGVLLMGHRLNGWWTGSVLDIHETRNLISGQNATTLQVGASILGALFYMIRHPREGLLVPDDLPHKDVLSVAQHYLGNCPSIQTDWNPLAARGDLYENYGNARPDDEDMWQFETFRFEGWGLAG